MVDRKTTIYRFVGRPAIYPLILTASAGSASSENDSGGAIEKRGTLEVGLSAGRSAYSFTFG